MFKTKRKEKQVLRLANSRASAQYAEAYKTLGTNIDFLAEQNCCRSIMVTSPMPGDGKTTVAVNLAYTLGNAGKKVILIDGDMRKGSIASCFCTDSSTYGLSELLSGKQVLTDFIIQRPDLKIDIVTAGRLPINSSELIGSTGMNDILCKLGKLYDYIIIDTPSVSLVTDAVMMSRVTDAVIIVARAGATEKQELDLCKKKLEAVNAHILGAVLNDYKRKSRLRRSKKYYSV